MKRPELLSALDQLASGTAGVASDALVLLLAQAPPRVTALFILKRDPSDLNPPLDICDLPRLDTILRSMIEVNCPAAALVLARQIMRWGPMFSLKDDGPEKKFASAFLGLARADPDGTGRLLHALLGQSPAEASKLMGVLETPGTESALVDATAHALGRALQNDSLTAGFIARSSRDHATAYRLLDRVVQNDASHATLLITAMLSADLDHFRSLLPTMIRENAPVLAVEILRRLSYRNPEGPWQDIVQSLEDADPHAALSRLDNCLMDRGSTPDPV